MFINTIQLLKIQANTCYHIAYVVVISESLRPFINHATGDLINKLTVRRLLQSVGYFNEHRSDLLAEEFFNYFSHADISRR
jgi:hypothetical protein